MNDVQRGWQQFDSWIISEILKAQARFLHITMAAIMPKELYDLAAADNQLDRCQKWATENGYYVKKKAGPDAETQVWKGDHVIARFKPTILGEGMNRHCEFLAVVLGKPVNVVVQEQVGQN